MSRGESVASQISVRPSVSETGPTNFEDVGLHVFLVVFLTCVFETGFVFVWVRGHQALDRDQDRLQALCRGPFFAAFASPRAGSQGQQLRFARPMCRRTASIYPRIDLAPQDRVSSRTMRAWGGGGVGGSLQANFPTSVDIRIEARSPRVGR